MYYFLMFIPVLVICDWPAPGSHGLLCDGGVGVPDLLPELGPPLLQDDPAGPESRTHVGCRHSEEEDQDKLNRSWKEQ